MQEKKLQIRIVSLKSKTTNKGKVNHAMGHETKLMLPPFCMRNKKALGRTCLCGRGRGVNTTHTLIPLHGPGRCEAVSAIGNEGLLSIG